MASRTTVTLVDDLDGDTADETVEFGIDRAEYEIDLTSSHAGELRDALARYVAAARRTGGRRAGPAARPSGPAPEPAARPDAAPSPQSRERNQEIRAWAAEHGAPLSERGRIPGAVVAAFEAGDPAALPARDGTTPAVVEDRAEATPASPGNDEPTRGRDGLTSEERETIRAWADGEGIEVKPRGQLKKDLIANYRSWAARQ
jgi:hypothetical protein